MEVFLERLAKIRPDSLPLKRRCFCHANPKQTSHR